MPAGSAYQGLILPAPRRSAPQRVVSQAPTLPPILVPHSPSTTYRPGAIQSHFTPPSQGPSHGSYSGAGLPPSPPSQPGQPTGLGAKLAAQGTPQETPAARLARVFAAVGNVTNASNPWERSQAKPAVEGQILSTWLALKGKGLLPRSAPMPKVVFDKNETAGAGAYVIMNSKGTRELHVPPSFVYSAAISKDPGLKDWARQATVHELAHTAQNAAAASSKPMVEGGAQAFALNATPAVHRNQNHGSAGSGSYQGYVDSMNTREPRNWIMHDQFVPGAHAPMVNMPGTKSFGIAMGGVGRQAGNAARFMAEEAGYRAQPVRFPIGLGGKIAGNVGQLAGYAANSVGYKVKPSKGYYQ